MKNYLKHHPWKVIEEGFHSQYNMITESCCSIGNGRMGQRANFEEQYSGETLQGSYLAGIYYPDKTKVGWWKNGYPEYFAKVLNAPNWIGINVMADGEVLDLATCKVKNFKRILNMKDGLLERSFTARLSSGKELKVKSTRFCSLREPELGVIRYSITPLNFQGKLTITPYVDGDIVNKDANWDEKFWNEISRMFKNRSGFVITETKKTEFRVCTGMRFNITKNNTDLKFESTTHEDEKYISCKVDVTCKSGDEIVVYKYAAITTSFYHEKSQLFDISKELLKSAEKKGFKTLLKEHSDSWAAKWDEADITVTGDEAAQQGIRFNIFHLYQTYTGEDDRLNIGPKGFTGEKYGGSTYWDTEAYCIPFYMSTADESVARKLLVYRHKHLPKAIENAAKLGFTNGAALYPMVTMNGEECHNEWEITFEEIHRNGAIAYAIYDYIRYTGDEAYLAERGLEVLIGIARFWTQRVHWSVPQKKYVMHGVTGPNEYENNVNNNWYTNYLAAWCLTYAGEALENVKKSAPKQLSKIEKLTKLDNPAEPMKWLEIASSIYLPEDKNLGIFLQQDGYLEKELLTVKDLKPEQRPINQKWSWDRILRSCFIKQADVLQGIYFFEDRFAEDVIRRNFDFYEPKTVHESSLSACVHAILACKLGKEEKAYEMYLRTARLDLDDYNNDTEDGLHITSMAGTWMAFVEGFGGLRAEKDMLSLNPILPSGWQDYSFKLRWRGFHILVKHSKTSTTIVNLEDKALKIRVKGNLLEIPPKSELNV